MFLSDRYVLFVFFWGEHLLTFIDRNDEIRSNEVKLGVKRILDNSEVLQELTLIDLESLEARVRSAIKRRYQSYEDREFRLDDSKRLKLE